MRNRHVVHRVCVLLSTAIVRNTCRMVAESHRDELKTARLVPSTRRPRVTPRAFTDSRVAAFHRALRHWARSSSRAFPWRETKDPFRILIAEVLLQRSRSSTVAAVYRELFERWPTATDLAAAAVDDLRCTIRPLGLLRRAESLIAVANAVSASGMPRTIVGLVELPGVGPYAAAATAAAAYGDTSGAVDGTSARVYRRYFGLRGATDSSVDAELWRLVAEVTPKTHSKSWNWAVLDLAATVCLPKRPLCDSCQLSGGCLSASTADGDAHVGGAT
jgi:A/G-specific adenine glycosylase